MLTRTMPNALVYGGSGALGRAVVSQFRKADWNVVSLDFSENPDASLNIILDRTKSATSLSANGDDIGLRVGNALGADKKLDAILTVAGGWTGGNLLDKDLFLNTELMVSQNIYSSVIAAKLASTYLREGGLLALTGASAATHGTPGMV
ncbi:hypothetical protein BASA61_002197 [Batrachochytrium salamandrivorans]|nr:hypothetical protein BASA62_007253 [Batrachochytrium salamandrivorans]KAH6600779.1 hypothetical protein BASA61_002197 [Batrachochytrium salamandrivorans]KAH9266673.1 hypothetical protein BASA84_001026 [Batrachochytrium salamandrivorans]